MTENELKPIWKGMLRLWVPPDEWYRYDEMFNEWAEEFKDLPVEGFRACCTHLRQTFKPTFGEKFPVASRIWEAQAALSQQQAKSLVTDDVDNDPKYQEYERLLSEIRTLPTERYNHLVSIAKPRVQAKIPANTTREIKEICERGLFAGEMVRAYCEQTGEECPI